jgi:nucleoside 2-deoxyribosyltransferase
MGIEDEDKPSEVTAGGSNHAGESGASKKAASKTRPKRGKSKRPPAKSGGARRPYPRVTLEEALRVPLALKDKNGGNPWPPADVAAAVGLSHKNPDFFYMAAASRDFGLTEGSRDSDLISLTEFGRDVVYAPTKTEEDAKLREALLKVDIFRKVLEYYKGANLPEMQYLGNTLVREFNLDPSFHQEFSKLFKENCTFLKIGSGFTTGQVAQPADTAASTVILAEPSKETGLKCFAAMPFRERENARSQGFFDEVLRALIAPAGRDAGFEVVTANRDGSDVIQATIVNQLLDADLVIADLTENNPNVLFELGLRIAEDKPVALIRAKGTPAIFDVDNMLRVFEYDPNLWTSTVEHDRPKLTEHIKAAWENRDSCLTFMKILRERKAPASRAGGA